MIMRPTVWPAILLASFLAPSTAWDGSDAADTSDSRPLSIEGYTEKVSYKPGEELALHASTTALWSHHLVGRPENRLTGVGFLFGGFHRSHDQFMDGKASYTVHRPEHWLLAGTGLDRGAEFGGKDTIVGYECDGCEFEMRDGLPVPTHRDGTPDGFTILASCPAKWHPNDALWYERFPANRVGAAVLGTYTRGGTVVTVGSTDWAHGLKGKDPTVERITRNVLDRLGR